MLPRPPVLSDVGGHLSRSRTSPANPQRKANQYRVSHPSARPADTAAARCEAPIVAHTSATASSTIPGHDLAAFCAANRIPLTFAQDLSIDATVATSPRAQLEAAAGARDEACVSPASTSSSEADFDAMVGAGMASPSGCTVITIGQVPITVPLVVIPESQLEGDESSSTPGPAHPASIVEEPVHALASSADSHAYSSSSSAAAAEEDDQQYNKRASKLRATSAEFYPRGYAAAATGIAAAAVAATGSPTSSYDGSEEGPAPAEAPAAMETPQVVPPGYAPPAPPMQPMAPPTMFYHPVYYPAPFYTMLPHLMAAPVPPVSPAGTFPPPMPGFLPSPGHMPLQMIPGPGPFLPPPQQAGPYSPLPADTASLMAPPSSLASLDLDRDDDNYSTTSSLAVSTTSTSYPRRPSSAASSSSFAATQRPRIPRSLLQADDVVTVSALSSVKDAAGAVAKVLQRSSGGLLLALHRRGAGDTPAAASLLAVKTLAVARFYINTRMAAMGAAGVNAAAALLGLPPAAQGSDNSSSSNSQQGGAEATQQQQQQSGREEVLFIPFSRPASNRSVGSPLLPPTGQGSSQPAAAAAAVGPDTFGFLMSKVDSSKVPVALPAPVGPPACMAASLKQQQQQQQQQTSASEQQAPAHAQASSSPSTPAAAAGGGQQPPLLKVSARTDTTKLATALVHHLVSQGRCAVQLAGAPACQVVLGALVAARQRLLRRFRCGLVAVASFTSEDTVSALGRSTVFLRLDLLRCESEGELLGPGAREYLSLATA